MARTNKSSKTNAQTTVEVKDAQATVMTTPAKPKRAPKGKKVVVQAPVVLTHKLGGKTSEKRPGVLATIKASVMGCKGLEDGLTKEQILDRLCAAFPERPRENMKATVGMWVPSGARNEHQIIIASGQREDGDKKVTVYWYDEKATVEFKKAAGK